MSVHEEANDVVGAYVDKEMKAAYERIQQLKRTRHILQKDAVKAVTQWNSWVRWLMPKGECDKTKTFVLKRTDRGEIIIKKWGEE
jgi:hypothetical protein